MRYATGAVLLLYAAAWGCGGGKEEMPEPATALRPTPAPLPPAVGPSPDYSRFTPVSMVRLLAAPESANKKAVSVVGYLSLSSPNCDDCGSLLCFHKEDVENRLGPNCVGVDAPASAARLNRRYVEVQGLVVVRHSFASIEDVVRVSPVPNQAQWEAGLWAK